MYLVVIIWRSPVAGRNPRRDRQQRWEQSIKEATASAAAEKASEPSPKRPKAEIGNESVASGSAQQAPAAAAVPLAVATPSAKAAPPEVQRREEMQE